LEFFTPSDVKAESLPIFFWRLERLALVVMIYAIPLRESVKNIAWGFLIFSFLARLAVERSHKRLGFGGAPGLWLGLWLLMGLISSCFAIEMYASWKGAWDLARGTLLFYVLYNHATTVRLRESTLSHLAFSGAAGAAVGFYYYAKDASKPDVLFDLIHLQIPSVGHFNQSGIYLALIWFAALGVVFMRRNRLFRVTAVGSLIIIGLALLCTTARSATASMMVATILTLLYIKASRWSYLPLILLVLAAVAGVFLAPEIKGRLFFTGSIDNRALIWESALDVASKHPITGVGLNNFGNVALQTQNPADFGTIDHAHSLYFNALAQTGIPGLSFLLFLMASLAVITWKHLAEARHPAPGTGPSGLAIAGFGMWLTTALIGLTNTSLHHELSMVFFIAMGLVASAQKKNDYKQDHE
jgi:O-antigen ligase